MTDVQLEKQQYVTGPLAAFLESTFGGKVEGADYTVDAGNEYVHVLYASGRSQRVCVTGDSIIAIAEDVLKAVL